ncbi:uncharacterized protein BN781_01747 [Coprococcus sp. CAG:782]|uniref:hypothetical protein n=1 Tax=Coprococcus sp. OM04-5BH TaxID=2293093 RepID=UPI0003394613|nr:hypothetical protein [Coprococcus sp. OM04-5BH]RHV32533.1 hypothetical protein DXB54_06070 [Coprococcus sp. OM04-5BH]CCY53361.1 uncharacterized protein BN781_01747 [Coprococcus sp. CAG:782]
MDRGQYGYLKRHKKKVIISIISTGIIIVAGVALSLFLFGTTKTVMIIVPILTALPFSKQVVALILCGKFHWLTEEEYKRTETEIPEDIRRDLLYDVSISRYEGMIYFPVVLVRDGRMIFYYNGSFNSKIKDKNELKKAIDKVFEQTPKPYLAVVTTDLEDFIKKACGVRNVHEDFVNKDGRVKKKILELGL